MDFSLCFTRFRVCLSDCLFALLARAYLCVWLGLCDISSKHFFPRDRNPLYFIHTIPRLPSNCILARENKEWEWNPPLFQNATHDELLRAPTWEAIVFYIIEGLSLTLRGLTSNGKNETFAVCLYSLNSKVKIFVANSRGHFSIFMWFNEGLEEKNTNSEVIFAVLT